MRRIEAVELVTLDGVMQGPGSPDEDMRGGFTQGGWAPPFADDELIEEMSTGFGQNEILLGRWTYEKFYAYWPTAPRPNPFTDVLNETMKYVASNTLTEPLPWVNSTLLAGDTAASVAELKAKPGKDLVVLGSGALVTELIAKDLVDRFTLVIHPLLLGSGRRLFPDGLPPARLKLTRSVPTTTGVLIARYERAAETDDEEVTR